MIKSGGRRDLSKVRVIEAADLVAIMEVARAALAAIVAAALAETAAGTDISMFITFFLILLTSYQLYPIYLDLEY